MLDEVIGWASMLAPEKWMVLGVAAVIALVASLFIASPAVLRRLGSWQLHGRVRRMGDEVLECARIPDGLGGTLDIDFLVRGQRGITVVMVKRYPGVIFAAENMELWVQMTRSGSHKFPNPLPALRLREAAVRALIPDVPVHGVLLFARGSQFPKGKPPQVMTLDELNDRHHGHDGQGLWPELEHGWERLRLQANEMAAPDT